MALAEKLTLSDTTWLNCPKLREMMKDVRKQLVAHLEKIIDTNNVPDEMLTFRYKGGDMPFPPIPIPEEIAAGLQALDTPREILEKFVEALFPSTINAVQEGACFFCTFGHVKNCHYPYRCGDDRAENCKHTQNKKLGIEY